MSDERYGAAPVTVYLGLGSNLGDRLKNLRRGLELLRAEVSVEAVSSVYATEPQGYSRQPLFLNAVCRGETRLQPYPLLAFVKEVEKALGREPSFRDAPRTLDVDILLYGGLTMDEPELQIPHRRIAERAFVLVPLCELAPALVHPLLGEPIHSLLEKVAGRAGVKRFEGGLSW